MNFGQICADIEMYDLHAPHWDPVVLAQSNASHLFFYGPPGVGKYAHAIHFMRAFSPSRFHGPGAFFHLEQEVPMLSHYAKLPAQSFSFPTSDIHMEIDMEQLGDDPLTIWNAVCQRASDTFLFLLCRHIDKAPAMILKRLYTYIHPQWPPTEKPPLRFLFLGENMCSVPPSILDHVRVVSFPRPSIDQYNQCARLMAPRMPSIGLEEEKGRELDMDPVDIIQIQEFIALSKLPASHKIEAEDPFGPLCEKMVEYIQSVHSEETVHLFSIEEIRHILTEWEMYRICYEEGIWYVFGRFLAAGQFTPDQVKTMVHAWGQSGPYYASDTCTRYNKKRAEYMMAELISVLYTPIGIG